MKSAKISVEQVDEARKRNRAGESLSSIAKEYGVAAQSLYYRLGKKTKPVKAKRRKFKAPVTMELLPLAPVVPKSLGQVMLMLVPMDQVSQVIGALSANR